MGEIVNPSVLLVLYLTLLHYVLNVNGSYQHQHTREMSLTPTRILKDTLLSAGLGQSLKKALVDIETDIVSAISPLTFSGTLYDWKILTPAFAQAQHRSLQSQNGEVRGLNEKGQRLLSSNIDEVHFDLYQDRSDFKRYARINLLQNPASQNISQVPPGAQVKILIHGFQSGPALPFALGAKNAYLKETDHSVIVVDWEMLSLPKTKITLFYYPAVTANAMRVGEKVARLIEYLFETGVISDLAQVHVIGHSLGAHAAGYAGDLINSRYGAKIGRITALDAAFLAFLGPNVQHRVDEDDALFVDAIHTSGMGIYDAIGHVDFYPNGGRNQANCYNEEQYQGNPSRDNRLIRTFEKLIQSCSHARAYHYFIQTISRHNVFWACNCASWKDYRTHCRQSCMQREVFGEYVLPTARGKYFLEMDP